jgi:hypothetical protein
MELWRRFEFGLTAVHLESNSISARAAIIKQNDFLLYDKECSKYLTQKPILTPQLDPLSNEVLLTVVSKINSISIIYFMALSGTLLIL